MRIILINNETGDERIVGVNGCEMLIGSDSECDVILEQSNSDSSAEIFEHHVLLARIGHHIYIRSKRDEYGIIKPFYQEEPNEHGTFTNWDKDDRRIDANPFEVGHYTITAFR